MVQLVILLVALTPVALIVVYARRPADIDVTVTGSELVVSPHGLDTVWTFRRRLAFPVDEVRGVTVALLRDVPAGGLRLPGIAIPGVIRAGSYGVGAARVFWDVRRGPEVLWIELVEGASYCRMVLEVDDPHALALALRPRLGAWVPTEWQS